MPKKRRPLLPSQEEDVTRMVKEIATQFPRTTMLDLLEVVGAAWLRIYQLAERGGKVESMAPGMERPIAAMADSNEDPFILEAVIRRTTKHKVI